MTLVLCDLGGTHARFALYDGGEEIHHPVKLKARDYPGLYEAARAYLDEHKVSDCRGLVLAAAGSVSRAWLVDTKILAEGGVPLLREVNDFGAQAWGITRTGADLFTCLRAGRERLDKPRSIIGPGTGLGLAVAVPDGRGLWIVQNTHGGHMLAALMTDEHRAVAEVLKEYVHVPPMPIYEHFIGGRNFPALYRAVCAVHGFDARDVADAAAVLELKNHPSLPVTLRIFHEMLGLFAHQAVLMTGAFGGVYLTGGLVSYLRACGFFDADLFLRFMTLDPVSIVRDSLDGMPVWLVNDPFNALYGLAVMLNTEGKPA